MALAVTAYNHLLPLRGGHEYGDGCSSAGHVYAFAYDDFPKSFRGIAVTAHDRHKGWLIGGCMIPTAATERHHFDAGSYFGYGKWREDLAARFNPDQDPDQPFGELIWFADNEGSIGPLAAADLARDFADYRNAYRAGVDRPDYVRLYDHFARAAMLAARDGLIDFG